MIAPRFDVNDDALRDDFLRHTFLDALAALQAEMQPRWGRMTAQEMVEHLWWTFQISTGRLVVECPVPAERREPMKKFLHRNMPTPPEFMNPVLTGGLPPLRHPDLDRARAALREELEWFFAQAASDPAAVYTHPIFGPVGLDEWNRTHYKHCFHHLLQFGLLAAEG